MIDRDVAARSPSNHSLASLPSPTGFPMFPSDLKRIVFNGTVYPVCLLKEEIMLRMVQTRVHPHPRRDQQILIVSSDHSAQLISAQPVSGDYSHLHAMSARPYPFVAKMRHKVAD